VSRRNHMLESVSCHPPLRTASRTTRPCSMAESHDGLSLFYREAAAAIVLRPSPIFSFLIDSPILLVSQRATSPLFLPTCCHIQCHAHSFAWLRTDMGWRCFASVRTGIGLKTWPHGLDDMGPFVG
jgi:hypothetical protein